MTATTSREPSDRAYRETGVIIARILRIAAEREAAKAARAA